MERPDPHFGEMLCSHLEGLWRAARHLSRSAPEAEDLLQETVARALRGARSFRTGTSGRRWLYTIMVNVARNERKRSRLSPIVAVEDPSSIEPATERVRTPSPEDEVVAAAFDDEVDAALRALPDEYREVVLLADVSELTYQEIAEALACPVGTVRSRLSRGRQMLYEALEVFAHRTGRLGSNPVAL